VTIAAAAEALRSTVPTITNALKHLTSLSIVREATGSRRNRVFAYVPYLNLINEGSEPL
jgi:hypothetical protein